MFFAEIMRHNINFYASSLQAIFFWFSASSEGTKLKRIDLIYSMASVEKKPQIST